MRKSCIFVCMVETCMDVTSSILKRGVLSSMDIAFTCCCFLIYVIRLCRARMTSMDAYAKFCFFSIRKNDFVTYLEAVVASGIL